MCNVWCGRYELRQQFINTIIHSKYAHSPSHSITHYKLTVKISHVYKISSRCISFAGEFHLLHDLNKLIMWLFINSIGREPEKFQDTKIDWQKVPSFQLLSIEISSNLSTNTTNELRNTCQVRCEPRSLQTNSLVQP